uniref:Uncharacterized protein n=1 Tax=Cucumis sativus TaxID=3659 RepID=A0A0A0KS74_CUCSA
MTRKSGGGVAKRKKGPVLQDPTVHIQSHLLLPFRLLRFLLYMLLSFPPFLSLPQSINPPIPLHYIAKRLRKWQILRTFSHSYVIMEREWLRLGLLEMMLQELCFLVL